MNRGARRLAVTVAILLWLGGALAAVQAVLQTGSWVAWARAVEGVVLLLAGFGFFDLHRWMRGADRLQRLIDAVEPAQLDGPIRWMTSRTGRGRMRIGVEGPCSGSPHCAGAIHLLEHAAEPGGLARTLEIHLAADEVALIAGRLLAARGLHLEQRGR